jgi:cellulose synthase/poly-beta-1,6-N-acetylglucosamine synthase-like glycosyltransferase
MSVFVSIVFAYFIAFAVFFGWLLVMAAVEVRHYTSSFRVVNLRRTVRSPLAAPISILVPAFNEVAGITDSVKSLLALEYPTLEVVVISDGSTDGTIDHLIAEFDLERVERPTPPFLSHEPVTAVYAPRGRLKLLVLDKENGGKADSLNAGINFASYPLVCAIDADSVLEQDALVKTAMPFLDDPVKTIATGGLVRIANGCRVERGRMAEARLPRKALPMFQVVEYLRAFFGARTGWSAVNGLTIVSGAFGLFRKDVVIAVGGYRTDTVGEDMELVVRLHREMRRQRRDYRIVYVPDPVCWTEAPESLRVLRRQRRRWQRGSMETLLMHLPMLGNPRYGSVGLLSLPALLVFEILGPVIELAGYGVAIAALATGTLNLQIFILFLAVAVLYGLVLSFGAIALEDASFGRHSGWDQLSRVLRYAVLENFGYRQLSHIWRLEGFWQLIRKGDWGAMERKGLAGQPESRPAVSGGAVGLR